MRMGCETAFNFGYVMTKCGGVECTCMIISPSISCSLLPESVL